MLLKFTSFVVVFLLTIGIALGQCKEKFILNDQCGEIKASGGKAPNTPSIFCVGDTVFIQNNSSPTSSIKYTYIDWRDGNCEVYSGAPSLISHVYNYSKDTCVLGSGTVNIEVKLAVESECANGTSNDYIITPIKIKLKPWAKFDISGPICVGNNITFNNTSCINGKLEGYQWFLDGSLVSTTEDFQYTFKDTFNHTIALTVSNECGSKTTSTTLKPLPKPKASLYVVSGIILPDTVCLTNPIVWLHGLKSEGSKTYRWEVKRGPGGSNSGWNFITRTDSTFVGIKFTVKGQYTIELTVNNDCNEPSKAIFHVNVFEQPKVMLPSIGDNCAPFTLKLDWAQLKDAKVTLNGIRVTKDTLLGKGNYVLQAFAYSPCGSVTESRSFTVNDKSTPAITLQSDSVCVGTRLVLRSNPGASRWFVNGTRLPDSVFVFNQPGQYQLIAVNSPGTSCESRDTAGITAIAVRSLTLTPQSDQCAPFTYRIPDKKSFATYYLNNQVFTLDEVVLGAGQYIVRAVYKDFCSDYDLLDTFIISNKENLNITYPEDHDTLCINTSVQFTSNLTSVTWQGPGIIPASGIFNTSIGGNYLIQAIYAAGTTCEVRDTARVYVMISPQITLPDIQVECAPFAYPVPNQIANEYYTINGLPLWPNFPVAPGRYLVEVTYSDLCVQYHLKDSFEVVDQPNFLLTYAPGQDTLCLGNEVVIKGNIASLHWSGSGISNTIADSLTIQLNQTGSYSVYATALPGSSCEQRDTVTFFVRDLNVQVEDQSFCEGVSVVTLNALPASGTYIVNGCPTCMQGNQFLVSNYPGQFPVQMEYRVDDGTCLRNENFQLSRIEPGAGFSLDTLLCAGSAFTANTAQSQADFLQWKINGVEVDDLPEAEGFNEGAYTLELVAVIGACRDSIELNIDVITAPPALQLSLDPKVGCTPLTTFATTQDTLYRQTAYKWKYQYQGIEVAKSLHVQDTFLWINPSQEIAIIPLELKASNICGQWMLVDTMKVLPLPLAELGIDSSSTGCSPYSVIITNRATGYPDSCLLSINGVLEATSCFDTLRRTFFATDSTEIIALSLQVINQCGANTWQDTVNVIPAFVDAYFELDKYTICPNDTITFMDATTPKPLWVSWDFGDGGRQNGNMARHSYDFGDTTLQVVLRVSNGCGYDTLIRKIKLLPEPLLSFDLPPFACQGDEVSIFNTSPDNYFSYLWDFGDGSSLSAYQPKHLFQNGTNSAITLKVTDWNLCTNTLTKPLQIQPAPELGYTLSSDKACIGKPIQLIAESKYVDQIEWFINGARQSSGQTIEFLPSDNIYDIKIIGSYKQRCKDSLVDVAAFKGVRCDVVAPLAISLIAEEINNKFFTIYSVDNSVATIVDLKIFSRWGELVFSKQNFPPNLPAHGWNGILDGEKTNGGVYVWRAEIRYFDGTATVITGDLTVLQ